MLAKIRDELALRQLRMFAYVPGIERTRAKAAAACLHLRAYPHPVHRRTLPVLKFLTR
jgi:hypothetical protein